MITRPPLPRGLSFEYGPKQVTRFSTGQDLAGKVQGLLWFVWKFLVGVKSQGTKCSRVRVGVGGRSKGQYLALEGATNKSDWVRVGGCIILITSHPLPRGLGFNDGPDQVTRFSTGGVGVIVGNAFSSLRGDR